MVTPENRRQGERGVYTGVALATIGAMGLGLFALSQIDGKPSEPRADDGNLPQASASVTPGGGSEVSGENADRLSPLPDPDEHDGTIRTFGLRVDEGDEGKTIVIPCEETSGYRFFRHNRELHTDVAGVAFSGAKFGSFAVVREGKLTEFVFGRPYVEPDKLEPGVAHKIRDPEAKALDGATEITLYDSTTGQKATVLLEQIENTNKLRIDGRCTTPVGVGMTDAELLASIPN